MKTAFITGANKGIGFETAKQLLELGYKVFLGSRNLENGEKAIKQLQESGLSNVILTPIDVSDLESIKNARKIIEENCERLDLLINNAGIRGEIPQPASRLSIEVIRNVFETNFFGVINVTQTMIPLMNNSSNPIIINVTSDLASLTNHSNPDWEYYRFKSSAYSPSKTALNAYTVMLAHELKNENFIVNAVNPGHTATDFNQYKGEKTASEGAKVIVNYAINENAKLTGKYLGENGEIPW